MKTVGRMLLVLWTLGMAGAVLAEGLYDEGRYRALVADPRAVRVGDNLTVVVTEIASMTTTARTATDKDGSVSVGVRNTNGIKYQGGVDLSDDFTGGGRIERSGKLMAQVTVVIQEVRPNGDLWVKGEQEILVNDETQRLFVEGRLRPEDVRADNTVPSSRLSEAKITFTGEGLLAEKQKPGILTRFLSWLRIL